MVYFKGGRFHNTEYLNQISTYLDIVNLFDLNYNECITKLKLAKAAYLDLKKNHQDLRAEFALNMNQTNIKQKLRKEKEWFQWKKL